MHELSPSARNGSDQDPGPVPPTQGPGGPKPAEATPRAEAFPLADFDQAQKALAEIRSTIAYARALVASFPDASHIKVNTDRMKQHMAAIITRLEAAERACLSLGLPF